MRSSISPEKWVIIKKLLEEALNQDVDTRTTYLENACSNDQDLLKDVMEYWECYKKADDFMESPAINYVEQESNLNNPESQLGEYLLSDENNTSNQNSYDDLIGQTLDDLYKIEKKIGEGGMGVVFQGRHLLLGDKVAIKIIPTSLQSNSVYRHRFIREGTAARRFSHPNAVAVYDLRTTKDNLLYMVLEFVEGENLAVELKRAKRFSPKEALEILKPVAAALSAAHSTGVIHRDLKPDNIMLSKDSSGKLVVKLLDLGVAKIQSAEITNLTQTGIILGTLTYCSPEQIENSKEVDKFSDIYSLGFIFYELIAGRKPIEGNSILNIIKQVAMDTPQPLHEVCADVPEAFSRIIAQALAKETSLRPASCNELIIKLESALEEEQEAIGSDLDIPFSAPKEIEQPAHISNPAQTQLGYKKAIYLSITSLISISCIVGFIYYFSNQKINNRSTVPTQPPVPTLTPIISNFEPLVLLQYWIEVDSSNRAITTNGIEKLILNSGQEFKFHFKSKVGGYLYIIGMGRDNKLTTFLTNKPIPLSGVKTNNIKSDEEFIFPMGDDHWIKLGEKKGIDIYTIIFSEESLELPVVLKERSNQIVPNEQIQQLIKLKAISQQVKLNTDQVTPNIKQVTINKNAIAKTPVIFEINIEHN